jgi:hypothetical protein
LHLSHIRFLSSVPHGGGAGGLGSSSYCWHAGKLGCLLLAGGPGGGGLKYV